MVGALRLPQVNVGGAVAHDGGAVENVDALAPSTMVFDSRWWSVTGERSATGVCRAWGHARAAA